MGHTETSTYDAGTGARLSLTGPNQLATQWTLNAFGRVTKELRADGNETRSYLKACQGSCPFGANVVQIADTFHDAARITVPQLSFSDNVGHNLGTQTFGFAGQIIYTDKTYDSIGRLRETSQPYFANTPRYLASKVNNYDELSRITSLENYSGAGTAQVTTTEYKGYLTTITNPLGQKRRELRNALQQLTEVTDPIGGKTKFNYDAFGNLIKTIDPSNNEIIVDYDSLGRKTALKDPDLGYISYKVNPLGQTWVQISPKQRAAGQQTKTVFDALGRMTARYEPDLESHWDYDTASKGIGQLQEAYTGTATNKTYSRTHSYDDKGRPQETIQSLTDGLYKSSTVYDDWGRVITINNTRGAVTKAFGQRYNAYGYLDRLERGALKLWQITKQDAANRVTEAQLGNGLTQTRSYNPYSALIEGGAAKTLNNEARLQEAYEYDGIGSVTKRSLYWTGIGDGFAEKYSYDDLNRLKTSAIELSSFPVQTYDYDATGNLLFKTNVSNGNYAYPAQGAGSIRPHAVQSIPGIGSFTYDDNGNQTSGAGRSLTWKSFDMPDRITKGSEYNEFKYGPEHQRTRQVNNTGDIIYAGTQEVDTKSGITTIRTYWPLGIGFEVDEGSNPTKLIWNHTDRLGSIVAQTDKDGQLAAKFAFDSWGHRFTLTGSATPDPKTLGGTLDHRGYTGHEMLDSLDMVHMNGRVYDPLLGKFVSADPYVTDPMNGQNYNRYSYVLNNPTNLTDPTGFDWTEFIPVYGSVKDFESSVGEGFFWTAAAFGTMAIVDGATLGVGQLATAPLKAMLKASIKAEIKEQLAKQAAEESTRLAAQSVKAAEAKAAKASAEKASEAAAAAETKGAATAPERVNAKNKYESGGKFSKKTKTEAAERAEGKCEYCGRETTQAKKSEKGVSPPRNEAQTDHIQPRSKGGDNSPENAAHACRDCNRKLSDSEKPNPRGKDQPPPPRRPEDKF